MYKIVETKQRVFFKIVSKVPGGKPYVSKYFNSESEAKKVLQQVNKPLAIYKLKKVIVKAQFSLIDERGHLYKYKAYSSRESAKKDLQQANKIRTLSDFINVANLKAYPSKQTLQTLFKKHNISSKLKLDVLMYYKYK